MLADLVRVRLNARRVAIVSHSFIKEHYSFNVRDGCLVIFLFCYIQTYGLS